MDTKGYLEKLWRSGAIFWVEAEQLRYKASKSLMTSDVLAFLKQNKPEILKLLSEDESIYRTPFIPPMTFSQDADPELVGMTMDFSLLFFSSNDASYENNKYQFFLDASRYADQQNFTAVWIPERHFNAFGGLYPNPSVMASALAMTTENIRLRAGSVVLPMHHPVRVAEEWSVVDNLSNGRVDIGFAQGWNARDFVLAPDNY